MLDNPSNFALISFSCKLVNNFELMFWKGGTNKYCHNILTSRLWTTTCVMYGWPVLLFEVTIVCVGNFSLYIPILCNFYISLTILYLWTLTGLYWILELKMIFWLRHNLEGKHDNFPYNQSDFYWLRLNSKWLRLTAVKSSEDKRSYNRLLFIERYRTS